MKRYLVFMNTNYYPSGGWDDFQESFDDVESAKREVENKIHPNSDYWAQIVDIEIGKVILTYNVWEVSKGFEWRKRNDD